MADDDTVLGAEPEVEAAGGGAPAGTAGPTRGVNNSPLAPSQEAAYYRKCRVLAGRILDIETQNDRKRVAINRARRAVKKLRLERALLLAAIEERMSAHLSDDDDDLDIKSPGIVSF
jgi:hypothetical protein